MEFVQVDVFANSAFRGNPLAVFPDAADLTADQMQAIASEMNLSETTFVTEVSPDRYRVRIFTPAEELPFAGHPTIGTAWVLRSLDRVKSDKVVQVSHAGETVVRADGERWSFARTGEAEDDLEDTDLRTPVNLAEALGLKPADIGLEARELGRSGMLRAAFADAGVRQLMVPLRGLEALQSCRPDNVRLAEVGEGGAYCFTAAGAGKLRARGFFPGFGVAEDPGTGSAAAALGLYLAKRLGSIELVIEQGVEMGRPCTIFLGAGPDGARVGGLCKLVFKGKLETLP